MENSLKVQETQNPSLLPSPKSHGSTSPSSNSQTNNGFHARSEPNSPYPTTFVQADTSSFKQVVQMLTGSNETTRLASKPDPVRSSIPPIKTGPRKDKSNSKLYERRNGLKNFKISPLGPGMVNGRSGFLSGYSGSPRPGTPEVLSPSILDFPSLVLSPVTPLIPDPFHREMGADNCGGELNMDAEDKAIQGKGFYMHPSPANTPRDKEPRLLPLFPIKNRSLKFLYGKRVLKKYKMSMLQFCILKNRSWRERQHEETEWKRRIGLMGLAVSGRVKEGSKES